MGSLRQGSLAKRLALSAFAVYALLLQAFLAAVAPADAFAFPGDPFGVTCSLDGSNSGAPGKGSVHHHGLCCILVCAAAACAYVGTVSATAAFPARAPSRIVYALTRALPTRPPLKHYFVARGPPAAI